MASPGITCGRCKALFRVLIEDHGPAGRYICLRDDSGGGKPVGGGEAAGPFAAYGQPQAFGVGGSLGHAPAGPLDTQAGTEVAGGAYLPAARNILDEVAAAAQLAAKEHWAIRGEQVVSASVLLGQMLVLPVVNA